ncbi:ATP-binding protein [Leptolyngbya sp. BC1307]|uniref:GAF domain-containing sensor histidine kinase n=1 Tax=Leptolyngbya sp. BC1307 TaxID=2029589 RepID=UPI000EFC1885|nr:ATP-binding protein [Leptolyngbya sp. BC1307]
MRSIPSDVPPDPPRKAVPAALPLNEQERMAKLLSYQILDTEAELAYDDLTTLAACICETETAMTSLIDDSRQWFKSRVGLSFSETPRDLALCAHTILEPEVMVVADATKDPRFAHHPLVIGEPHIRFYAGAPLITAEGYALGTICVIDSEPKQLTDKQIAALAALARQVVSQLDMRLTMQRIGETLGQLQQAQGQLVHSEKITSLGQMVAGVAHEINNPLGFVNGSIDLASEYGNDLIGLLQLYRNKYGEEDREIAETIKAIDLNFITADLVDMLDAMQIGTTRMTEIVRSLRNFSRLGREEFDLADIHDGIDSTLLLLSHRLKMIGQTQKPVTVTKCYGDIPEINCNFGQLNQVFMNLLANALDALGEMADSSALAEPTIWIETQALDDHVLVVIRDNGSGMSAARVEKIFDPFFTTKPLDQGTGLGLSISHQVITQKHRGELICQSQPGVGTTFTLKIPNDL